MLALGIFTALSFVSSVILYTIPQANPTVPDLSSAWISWSILLAICLVMSRRRMSTPDQQYEPLESGSPQIVDPTIRKAWDGVLLTALPAVLVAAGILANTQASQYWLPGLVVVSSILLFVRKSDEQPITLDQKGMIELPVVEVKPFDIWSFVCLGYSIILSSGVAWILYNNISMEQGRPWLLTTGAGFLLCMTMVWVILLRTSVTRETQYTETKERHESIDWQLATKTCAQAFFVATVLVTFTPGQLDKSITTILTGVLQAVRLASIFYLVPSGFAVMSATSQLAALGTAQALVMQDQSSVLAAAFVITSGITISVISMIPPGKIPLWASCLIMMAPLVPFAASMLHLPDLIPKLHPIESLYLDGKRRHEAMISRQSKTPAEAVVEYRKRYQREPPAGFEEWVELALKKGLVLVDEFDGMTKAFDPFYQLDPSILKQVLAATPRDLAELVEVNITSSEITWSAGKSGSYFGKSIRNWLSTDPAYMSILPNTTILVNTFDEPKTVMPVDLLVNGTKETDYKVKVDVISLGREHPWTNVTLSCAASSPARRNITIPPTDRIQFVSNLTESQDICTHRDFEQEYAFLNRPETLRIIHAPLPVWSQAAPSTFQDILFPSPYYEKHWSDYHAETDTHWEDKTPSIYWAGSTTGGRATPDNWRNMQRQRMVLNTMRKTGPHNITLLEQTKGGRKVWKQVAANSTSLQSLLNIFIGNVTQCDEPSCTEMKEAFAEKGDTAMQASQASKYVLDMDGNGFSGRYYRLLRSNSAVVKQTILKEWHDDWLVPWVHFIPLSLDGDEIWEMMRFLGTTGRGDEIGADIARGSTEWAGKVLRRVDTELVVLRLVLEYARLFDRVG